jgi:hypothetical protein
LYSAAEIIGVDQSAARNASRKIASLAGSGSLSLPWKNEKTLG